MTDITGIGANVFDTLYTVSEFPSEDTKKRADDMTLSGGGPCATGLVAASKLGAGCAYIGNITDDSAGNFLMNDFNKYGVSTKYLTLKKGFASFTSCIWLSEQAKTRTCVFHRGNIPPLELNEEQKKAVSASKILMIDGNELDAAIEGAKTARAGGTKVLYDAGGLYEGVERLIPLADILIPSEEFALAFTGAGDAENAAIALYEKYSPEVVVITQGKKGGVLYDGDTPQRYPSFPVDAVDTNGAGDVFHGAFAYCAIHGYSHMKSCIFSSAVSALKCTKQGARRGSPDINEVMNFLKERGYNEF